VVAIFQILWKNYQTPYHFEQKDYNNQKPIKIELSENVSFLNKAGIQNTLNQIPSHTKVIIDGTRTKDIHPDVIEIIEDFSLNAQTRDIDLELVNVKDCKLP